MNSKEATEMGLVSEVVINLEEEVTIPVAVSVQESELMKTDILDCIAKSSSAIFKSQQKDDPDLSFEEKRKIAYNLLEKSKNLFLARFGEQLKSQHLKYFVHSDDDYEMRYHIKRLERYLNNSSRKIDVKNRRYQALKIMVEKGDYFSEKEMMKRNPLLYDNLIGQFLTEDEKKKRDNIDTTNITFVNLLLESIDRDRHKIVKKAQEDAEDDALEENDSDDDFDDDDNDVDMRKKNSDKSKELLWGEMDGNNTHDKHQIEKKFTEINQHIPGKERQVLREEFVTHMYESFLDGKDTEFDYSSVDDNESYDNIAIRSQDEEEKYFDSESPETVLVENIRQNNDEEDDDDELDIYMKSLKEQISQTTS